jgi:hypothetical protein
MSRAKHLQMSGDDVGRVGVVEYSPRAYGVSLLEAPWTGRVGDNEKEDSGLPGARPSWV